MQLLVKLGFLTAVSAEIWNPKPYVENYWRGYGKNPVFTSIVKFNSTHGRLHLGKGTCIVTINSVGFDFVHFQDAWITEVQPTNRSFVIGVPDALGDRGSFSMRVETRHSEPLDSDFRVTCQNNHPIGNILLMSSFPNKIHNAPQHYYHGKFFVNNEDKLPRSVKLNFPEAKGPLDIEMGDPYLKAVSLWSTIGKW